MKCAISHLPQLWFIAFNLFTFAFSYSARPSSHVMLPRSDLRERQLSQQVQLDGQEGVERLSMAERVLMSSKGERANNPLAAATARDQDNDSREAQTKSASICSVREIPTDFADNCCLQKFSSGQSWQ
jgi:hypothetical protein